MNYICERTVDVVIQFSLWTFAGFHAFCDGNGNINALIKNIIHGRTAEMESTRHREWSPSESLSRSRVIEDDAPIPTDSNLMGISQRIINTPNIEHENPTSYDGGNLLNDFMEEKYVENRRTSADGMCLCHEDDPGGFTGMWDALNLDAIRMQYDALKSADGRQRAIRHQHEKTIRSMEWYFDFIRSIHHQRFGTQFGE